MTTQIVDYDNTGYDYQSYWDGRDYERRAEDRALGRLVPQLGPAGWLVDLGGGFGRNARHYRGVADRYVIADYSATNLANAGRLLADDVAAGRAFLVRCDLNALPFVDNAFDAGIVVRVLHHLPSVDRTLAEMSRVIGDRWLLDVPIKHHVLALLRAAARGERESLSSAEPRVMGSTADPFWNFRLDAVRQVLDGLGWRTGPAASVNNLRGWDQRVPRSVVRALAPVADAAEGVAQRAGRGWWGPSQFVLARRESPSSSRARSDGGVAAGGSLLASRGDGVGAHGDGFASRVVCPACRSELRWGLDEARCSGCGGRYSRTGGVWDFVV